MNRLNGAAPLGAGTPTAPSPDDPADAAEAAPAVVDALRDLLAGPMGLGTSAARLFRTDLALPAPPVAVPPPEQPAEGHSDGSGDSSGASGPTVRVPPLYCPDAERDDPALGEEVNNRLVEWAEEVGIFRGRLERLRSHNFGRLFMLAHPGTDDPERILTAARCGLAEWAVDDHWVDEGEDTTPELIGTRMALAHAVVDPVRLPARYLAQFENIVRKEPVLRAFRSCLDHLARIASPTQVARLRHELAVMFVGYNQEGEWRSSGRRPAVWEYLLHRYENAFYPCMVLIDPVGGYELPAAEFADARVRRTYLYAGTANVLLNDLYSMTKEDPTDTNLPNLIAAEDNCSLQEAVNRAACIHDELMHTVEAECAVLSAAGSPELRRYLAGLWAWMGGSKEWHATSPRYHGASTQ
ncbi:family 2 encapsulin nanocompartment cargo protein terpene cyclase [Streptomyces hesseae]|uniref:2-methylisoborneol synthase n=1 Tax=Streptomyces hesseae TaxID=3075519 RepID=A0ABU2SEU9_9ACTN|nr:family 2 encapsulin nanocompartment cargo protein terpene cyclase [Streptomyces sp. DSM 40473]MDT0447501.1 family 2 encapsulin nanocompartment cargo protein terpene cyclase [Streptomyces sp. DSM 40473]